MPISALKKAGDNRKQTGNIHSLRVPTVKTVIRSSTKVWVHNNTAKQSNTKVAYQVRAINYSWKLRTHAGFQIHVAPSHFNILQKEATKKRQCPMHKVKLSHFKYGTIMISLEHTKNRVEDATF